MLCLCNDVILFRKPADRLGWSCRWTNEVSIGCVCVPLEVTGIHLDCAALVFALLSSGTGADLPIQSNEAMAFRWMSGLINHLYLLQLSTFKFL